MADTDMADIYCASIINKVDAKCAMSKIYSLQREFTILPLFLISLSIWLSAAFLVSSYSKLSFPCKRLKIVCWGFAVKQKEISANNNKYNNNKFMHNPGNIISDSEQTQIMSC